MNMPQSSTGSSMPAGSAVQKAKKLPLVKRIKHAVKDQKNLYPVASLLRRSGVFIAVGLLLLTSAIGWALVWERTNALKEELLARQEVVAQSKAQVLSTWANGLMNTGRNVTESQLVRVFLAEATTLPDQSNVAVVDERQNQAELMTQWPYMQKAMADYVRQYHLEAAVIIDHNNRSFLTAGKEVELDAARLEGVMRVAQSGKPEMLFLRKDAGVLTADVLRPIYTPEAESNEGAPAGASHVVGVLLSRFSVGPDLTNIVNPGALAKPGERTLIVQKSAYGWEVLREDTLVRLTGETLDYLDKIKIGKQSGKGLKPYADPVFSTPAYMSAAAVPGLPFTVIQMTEESAALAALASYKKGIAMLAGLLVVLLLVGSVAALNHLLGLRDKGRVKTQDKVIAALIKAMEAKDIRLGGHHERMARLALKVANKMTMPVDERSTVYYASILSGVWKMLMPENGATQDTARTQFLRSLNILGDVEFDLPITQAISAMYERLDGSGHPAGLKGDDITRVARILGVCDMFCGMTSFSAPVERVLTPAAALQNLKSQPTRYDSEVLAALEEVMAEEGATAKA